MHRTHQAGDAVQVDYAGGTIAVTVEPVTAVTAPLPSAPVARPVSLAAGHSILVVEDDPSNRALMVHLLE